MSEHDISPIEELGFAKNAIVRTLEAYREQLPAEELKQLKLAYRNLNSVQQWFYQN